MPVFQKHKNTRPAAAIAAFAAVVIGLSGCKAPRAAVPAWLDNPSAAAPATGWWMAAAEGRTRAEAIDAATITLAQRIESRVIATEHFTETSLGTDLRRTGYIHTNVELVGAEVIAATRTNPHEHAALVGLDPRAAARILCARVTEALDAKPPRLTAQIADSIEQGAVLDPRAADWDSLRARLSHAIASAGPAAADVPPQIAAELQSAFGIGLTAATYAESPAASYRPGQTLTAWELTATVGGQPRRWAGVVAGGENAVGAAAARVRTEATIPP